MLPQRMTRQVITVSFLELSRVPSARDPSRDSCVLLELSRAPSTRDWSCDNCVLLELLRAPSARD